MVLGQSLLKKPISNEVNFKEIFPEFTVLSDGHFNFLLFCERTRPLVMSFSFPSESSDNPDIKSAEGASRLDGVGGEWSGRWQKTSSDFLQINVDSRERRTES